jgi:hypothetical protein
MAEIYLYLNAVLWIGLGIWCTLASEKTSASMGLTLASPAGRCEFITVYGGLELGLGAFFLYAAIEPAWTSAGILAALFSYGGLALLRLGAVLLVQDTGRGPLLMLGVEVVMAVWAAWIHFGA